MKIYLHSQKKFAPKAVLGYFILFFLIQSCQTDSQNKEHTGLKFKTFASNVISKKPNVLRFYNRGPYGFSTTKDFYIRVSKNEIINTDLYLSSHNAKAPLVIIQHGNLADKEDHKDQAKHLASWGFHALVVEQPNKNRWVKNGITLAKLIKLIKRWPILLNKKFDPQRIIAIGHSFGGSAITIAAGENAPLRGLILLDPAMVSNKVKSYLTRINIPTILLGADSRIFRSRKRSLFYKLISDNIAEVSLKNTTHNDAQAPNMFSLKQFLGIKQSPTEDRQKLFMAAITASVYSLSLRGDYKYAWRSFHPLIVKGEIIKPRKK